VEGSRSGAPPPCRCGCRRLGFARGETRQGLGSSPGRARPCRCAGTPCGVSPHCHRGGTTCGVAGEGSASVVANRRGRAPHCSGRCGGKSGWLPPCRGGIQAGGEKCRRSGACRSGCRASGRGGFEGQRTGLSTKRRWPCCSGARRLELEQPPVQRIHGQNPKVDTFTTKSNLSTFQSQLSQLFAQSQGETQINKSISQFVE